MKFWRIALLAVISLLLVWSGARVPIVRAQDEAGPAPVCPLSKDQTQKAIEAFAELAPVFKVDRCINCHGEVDPFAEDGGHEGDKVPQIPTADSAPLPTIRWIVRRPWLNLRNQVVTSNFQKGSG